MERREREPYTYTVSNGKVTGFEPYAAEPDGGPGAGMIERSGGRHDNLQPAAPVIADEPDFQPVSLQYGSGVMPGPAFGPIPETAEVRAGLGGDRNRQLALTEYSQSTGQFTHVDNDTGERTLLGAGYAGRGGGLNNPGTQNERDTGPLPQGYYYIGPLQTNVTGSA